MYFSFSTQTAAHYLCNTVELLVKNRRMSGVVSAATYTDRYLDGQLGKPPASSFLGFALFLLFKWHKVD